MADVNGSDHDEALRGLFSMVASDNAEVIPQAAPRGPEGMWSVAANTADEAGAGAASDDEHDTRGPNEFGSTNGAHAPNGLNGSGAHGDDAGSDDVWTTVDASGDGWPEDADPADTTGASAGQAFSTGPQAGAQDQGAGAAPPPFNGWDDPGPRWDTASSPFRRAPADSTGSIFSAEPVDHVDDVLDEADVVEDPSWAAPTAASEGSLFSNGSHLRRPTEGRRRPGAADARTAATEDPWVITDRRWDDSGVDWWDEAAQSAPAAPTSGDSWSDVRAGGPEPVELDDPQGYETAILRLHPQDRERAHVPLSVCGALLHEDEVVLGVVTGQMLGRPAAVAVTEERVLVVNDRRWQPVVDIFPIDGDLVVRGRHDRHVAALSFADPTRVSMVDGISEVLIAIELAGHIRDAGPRDPD